MPPTATIHAMNGSSATSTAGARLGKLAVFSNGTAKQAWRQGRLAFRERSVPQSECMNLNWWVNRKDGKGATCSKADFSVTTTSACSTPAVRAATAATIRSGGRPPEDGPMSRHDLMRIAMDLRRPIQFTRTSTPVFEHFRYRGRPRTTWAMAASDCGTRRMNFFFFLRRVILQRGTMTTLKVRRCWA